MAVANYEAANNRFPPAFVPGPDGRPWHSWRVLILPWIEEDSLFKQYRFDEPWDGPNNSRLAEHMPKVLAFSGTKMPSTATNYLAVVGKETMWPGGTGRTRDEIKDELGETVLIAENSGLGVHWMEPRDLAFDTMPFAIDDPSGVSSWYTYPAIVTADDMVYRLSKDTPPDALRAALTISGGEKVTRDGNTWTALADGRDRERK